MPSRLNLIPQKPPMAKGKLHQRFIAQGKVLEDPFEDKILPSWKLPKAQPSPPNPPPVAEETKAEPRRESQHRHKSSRKSKQPAGAAATPGHLKPAAAATPKGGAAAAAAHSASGAAAAAAHSASGLFRQVSAADETAATPKRAPKRGTREGVIGMVEEANSRQLAKFHVACRRIQRWYMRKSHRMRARRLIFKGYDFTAT